MTGLGAFPADALLVLALAWPTLLATAWCARALRRAVGVLSPTMALPALMLAVSGARPIVHLPGLFTGAVFSVDPTGRAFLLLTGLLWSTAALHARGYMRADPRRDAFTGFMLLTAVGNIGVTLAADGLSFYVFFALMTFAAYGLVVHTRSAEAFRAGRVYVVMAMAGEALVLAGLLTLAAHAERLDFGEVHAAYAATGDPSLIAMFLLFGFGIKAGLLPVHVWLPLAHPVAPTPASAVLSGAMIKAGVLGWLRFLPLGTLQLPAPGATALGLGLAATLYAAAVGIVQRDPKTVLAYSSVSQMGFFAAGVGAALLVPAAASMMTLAVVAYALHHAPAKAALFLAIGSLRMRREGTPRWRWVALAAVPALVLAGAPLTSGAIAKTALKYSLGDLPAPWSGVDLVLSLAAVGSTLLMARFLATLAARPVAGNAPGPTVQQQLAWLVLVVASAAAGIWIPATLTPLGELPYGSGAGYVAAALWPIALGAALTGVALFLARRYPAFTTPTVPAGDIVAIVEAALRRLVAAGRGAVLRWQDTGQRAGKPEKWRRQSRLLLRAAGTIPRRIEQNLELGAAFGVLFVALVLLLFVTLLPRQ